MATKDELKEMFSTGKRPTGDDFAQLIDGVEGPQGPKGSDGVDGGAGPQGEPGKDGFGTQEQYESIINRLDDIEERLDGTDTE